MTAPQAAEAIAEGVRRAMPGAQLTLMPLGDGGEGTAAAIASALSASHEILEAECETADPLRRGIRARYFIADGKRAYIESAAASGLTLLKPQERDIMRADTFGTGLLIADAARRGVSEITVCMGGTATCDCGRGAFEALQGADLGGVSFRLLCDVENPLCGPRGAARVFGPQKGASPDMTPLLERRLEEAAEFYRQRGGPDVRNMKYAGAAGGLSAMLMACFGATPLSGIEETLRILDFDSALADADLVITGEGRVDATSLAGKAPKGVLDAASRRGVPVVVIGGKVADREKLEKAGFLKIVQATPDGPDPEMSPADYLTAAAGNLLRDGTIFED